MKKTGFTFIELIITLAIFLILATLSIPWWRHFIVEHRMDVFFNRVTNAIYVTRLTAISRGEMVSLCGSADLKSCDGNWQTGMITIISATKKVVRQYPGLALGYRLIWRSSLGLNISLNFTADGFTQGQQGTFYLCPPAGQSMARRVIVNRTGRLRVERARVYAVCFSSR